MKGNKESCRAEVRRRLRLMTAEQMRLAGSAIGENVVATDEFNKASTVGCYLAMPSEVRTDGIIAACRAAGKRVAVPAFHAGDGSYRMAELEPDAKLAAGRWNIPEPESAIEADMRSIDLILVPGMALDSAGNRIGHGGGYYDRMLSSCAGGRPFKLALAFALQLFDSVPADEHDIRVNAIATENGILKIEA
jgi:5-formyltetrahydrofolate cyclo-ligase